MATPARAVRAVRAVRYGEGGFALKDRVDHAIYGLGTIVAISTHRTTIRFDQSGTRRFVTNLVKLTASDTPAPSRSRGRKKVVPPA